MKKGLHSEFLEVETGSAGAQRWMAQQMKLRRAQGRVRKCFWEGAQRHHSRRELKEKSVVAGAISHSLTREENVAIQRPLNVDGHWHQFKANRNLQFGVWWRLYSGQIAQL